jgi:hypothetical protein
MSKRDNRDEIVSKRVQAVIKEKQDKEQQELNKLHMRIPQLTKEEEDSLIESVENLVVQYYWTLTSAYDTHYFFITDDVFEKCDTFTSWVKKYDDLKKRALHQHVEFAKEWKTTEISQFLQALVKTWNECHSEYVLSWEKQNPFRIGIKRKTLV